jgi:hypothetical protein
MTLDDMSFLIMFWDKLIIAHMFHLSGFEQANNNYTSRVSVTKIPEESIILACYEQKADFHLGWRLYWHSGLAGLYTSL